MKSCNQLILIGNNPLLVKFILLSDLNMDSFDSLFFQYSIGMLVTQASKSQVVLKALPFSYTLNLENDEIKDIESMNPFSQKQSSFIKASLNTKATLILLLEEIWNTSVEFKEQERDEMILKIAPLNRSLWLLFSPPGQVQTEGWDFIKYQKLFFNFIKYNLIRFLNLMKFKIFSCFGNEQSLLLYLIILFFRYNSVKQLLSLSEIQKNQTLVIYFFFK